MHRRALEIRQGLHSTHPEDSMTAIEVAESHRSIGVLQLRMGAASEAEQSLEAAVHLALDHLFDPEVSGAGNTDPVRTPMTILPRTAALTVLADSLLNTAIASWSEEASNRALSVARDLAWARPLSAEGRTADAFALVYRAHIVGGLDPSEALQDYRKVNASFDELLRWDPYNDLWRREWAATGLVVSEGILACLQDEQQRCKKLAPDLREAERLNLEAIEQLRVLANKDPGNVSWGSDLAWALSVRAKVLKEKKQPDERLWALDEAVELYTQAAMDPSDVDAQWSRANAHRDRAAALADRNKTGAAIEDQRRAREILETVVKEHPSHLVFRGELVQTLDGEIALLPKNGDPAAAGALERQKKEQQTELERLQAVDAGDSYQNEIWTEQWERGKKAEQDKKWDAAVDAYRAEIETLRAAAAQEPNRAAVWYALAQKLFAGALAKAGRATESVSAYREGLDSAKKAAELASKNAKYQNHVHVVHVNLGAALQESGDLEEALREFRASLEPLNTALRLDPTDAQYHENESNAYDWIASTLEELSQREPERPDALREKRETALQKRVHASWRAAAFSSEMAKANNYHNLAMARRGLALFLFTEKDEVQAALNLMEQARLDVERTVAQDPSNPRYHYYLGDADIAVGILRRENAQIGGWEEAIRKGLVSIDHALSLAPKEAVYLKPYGGYRQYLGEELIKDHRVEAGRKELELALSAYEKAQKLSPKDLEIREVIEAVRVTLAR